MTSTITDKQIDGKLLNLLQSEFPLADEPFSEIGGILGISESEVITVSYTHLLAHET